MADVLVIGAGLAGLRAAMLLQQAGLDTRVLEAADHVGGRVRTRRRDGFAIDEGFQVLLTAYPEAQTAWPSGSIDLSSFQSGAFVHRGERAGKVMDPLRHPTSIVGTISSQIATIGDLPKLAALRWGVRHLDGLPENGSTETAAEFLKRLGFSERIRETFFRPFFGGVFLDEKLQVSASALRFVFAMFARGHASLPAGGMQALPHYLAQNLDVQTSRRVKAADASSVTFTDGSTLTAAYILDARPPENLRWASTRMMVFRTHEFETPPILHLAGDSDAPILHACVPSAVAPGYAPDGYSVIYATLRTHGPRATEKQITQCLAGWFDLEQDAIEYLECVDVKRALPESPTRRDHTIMVDGIYLAGDAHTHASIEGALRSGRRAAELILEHRCA